MKILTPVSVHITEIPPSFRFKGTIQIPCKILVGVNSEEVYLTGILDGQTFLGYKVVEPETELVELETELDMHMRQKELTV